MCCMRPSDGAFGVAAAVAALSPACNGSSQQGALVSDCMEEQLGGGVSWSQIVQWGVLFPPHTSRHCWSSCRGSHCPSPGDTDSHKPFFSTAKIWTL